MAFSRQQLAFQFKLHPTLYREQGDLKCPIQHQYEAVFRIDYIKKAMIRIHMHTLDLAIGYFADTGKRTEHREGRYHT